jgi:transcriptional regulator with XRE-family HTH domain
MGSLPEDAEMITPAQSRAARGLVEWSQSDLALRADLAESTIRSFEKGRRPLTMKNLAGVRHALEAAGVQFIDGNGGGPGVRLSSGAAPPSKAARKAAAAQAEKAAGEAIDRVLRRTAQPPAVKASRKRKLTKVPAELTDAAEPGEARGRPGDADADSGMDG